MKCPPSENTCYDPLFETTLSKVMEDFLTGKVDLSQNGPRFHLREPDTTPSKSQIHCQKLSETLERYLNDATLSIPQSQFNHLDITATGIEARARMSPLLDSFNL